MAEVLGALIIASEKAALVVKSCCSETGNETLLVAEKSNEEANPRFDKDFKTIADVLAQESVKVELSTRFPMLSKAIRGEESTEIDGVTIRLEETVEKTTELLSSLVSPELAKKMAVAAHTKFSFSLCDKLPKELPKINCADIEVWIDPIDATAEFISGVRSTANADQGLQCVTILIGAYLKQTGVPIVGVIHQPFVNKGRVVWGLSHGDTEHWGGSDMLKKTENKIILMSSAEKAEIKKKFESHGWTVEVVPGAGNKLLKVILGEASAYVSSQATTFRWDTCGPQAIMRAMGGDIVSFTTFTPLTYNDRHDADTQQYCNSDGIVAFAKPEMLDIIKKILM